MKTLRNCNPITTTAYYLLITGILMFTQNPVMLVMAFLGIVAYMAVSETHTDGKNIIFYITFFLILAIINPITSHKGITVLFVVNDAPITLEAVVFGIVSSGSIICILLLFRNFTTIMTRDKLLYVFGKLSPKIALILSMGIRYVSIFKERSRKIKDTQKTLGLYKQDNIFSKIKGDMRVFSILVTWSLENGIITADSMAARGYGLRRRTFFSNHHFDRRDLLLLIITLICSATTILGINAGGATFNCYPDIKMTDVNTVSLITYFGFGLLALLPAILERLEKIRWKYLQSKI